MYSYSQRIILQNLEDYSVEDYSVEDYSVDDYSVDDYSHAIVRLSLYLQSRKQPLCVRLVVESIAATKEGRVTIDSK